MIKISVKLDIQQARASFAGEAKEVNKAAARALNRVAITARKAADQEIRKRITLKSGVVKEAIKVVFPYGQRSLIRDIVATGSPIPLRDYQATQTKKGARFAVVKGQRKLYKRQGRPGFIIERIGGNVFVRTEDDPPGPRKGKIKKVFGPSITQRFRTKRVQQALETVINARWPIEFEREMKYRQSKL
jgi:hypothetical protein